MSAQSKSQPRTLKAAVIIIGNEILSGRTQDANIRFIAEKLMTRGIALAEVRIVPDIEDKIVKAVNELRAEADYVLTTGGIGPTHDDITAESIARAFGVDLHSSPEARRVMDEHYKGEWNEARLKMTMVPTGAELMPNPVSGAPGFVIGNVYVMAGVPRIMRGMVENILPMLEQGAQILSRTVGCCLRESVIAAALADLQWRYGDVDIGSYPHYREGPPDLSLVLRSVDEARLEAAVAELVQIIQDMGDTPVLMD